MSTEFEIIEKIEETVKVRIPKLYKVLLHNDNTTTFDFVINVLTRIFHKNTDEAVQICLQIHQQGIGIAGAPYTQEVAEEKTLEVIRFARANNYPLLATFEEL